MNQKNIAMRGALALTFLCIFQNSQSEADIFDVTAAADARVLSFFPNSNEGNGNLLSAYNNGSNNVQRTFVQFDLSGQSGLTVSGDGILTLSTTGDGNNFLSNGRLFLADASWAENLITWNNQPSTFGAALSSVSGTFSDTTSQTVSWTVPQAVLQGWLDNPSTNRGFALYSDSGSTLTFHSREWLPGVFSPRLGFTASIPEPGALLVGMCALPFALAIRRPRRG
jgi:hypothetical protein